MRPTVLSVVLLVACASTTPSPSPSTSPSPSPSPSPRPSRSPAPLPLLEARADLDGVRLGPAPGVPTLVVVFASWCGACRAELATVDAVRARHPTLRVVGLNAYEEWGALSDEARLRAFVGEHAAWLRVVPAGDDLLPALGGVPKIPSLFVYDRAGRLAAAFRRDRRAPPDAAELDAALAAAAR